MNSLSMGVFRAEFNCAAAIARPSSAATQIRGGSNGGPRIFACASSETNENGGERGGRKRRSTNKSSATSSLLSRSQTYALLKQKMEVAAKSEVGV